MSGVVYGRGEVRSGGILLASFRVDSGSVTIDRKNASRRVCSVTLTSGERSDGGALPIIPSTSTDLFAPFGNELYLYYVTDGVPTQVGIFEITDANIQDSGTDLGMTVSGSDRAKSFGQSGFTDVYTIAAGTNVAVAIRNLLSSRVVGFTPTFALQVTSQVTPTTPLIYGPGDDPWQKATELAESIGSELFVDAFGVVTMVAVPDPSQSAVDATYAEGINNTAISINRKLSRTATPNYIIRDGSGSGLAAPVRGIAQDSNLQSPTYVNGPYGTVVDYQSSNLYSTQAQAQSAAQAALLLAQGSVETVAIDIIPDPSRDVDDVISVTRARAGISPGTKYVVDVVTMGFDHSTLMNLQARAVAGIV